MTARMWTPWRWSVRASPNGCAAVASGLGDAKELFPSLPAPPPWDVSFQDSEHSRVHMLWEYGVVGPRLRPGGFLLSDDVPDNDAFVTFSRSVGTSPFPWLRRGAMRKHSTGLPGPSSVAR